MKGVVLIFAVLIASALGRQGFGPTEQEWGFVEVRPGAHIFWWLQQALNTQSYTERPVIIWLQGGPGSSSTGFGNFAELGPLDVDLKPRDFTWINDANVLFVDNPVGTGFSYVDSYDLFTTTNKQIADDFVAFLQGFYDTLPELKAVPLYIFCESYGGKMTAEIALAIDQAIKAGTLDINLPGIGLGDSWISPVDSVLTWGPYLLSVGAVDQNGYEEIQEVAELTKKSADDGKWAQATSYWSETEGVVLSETDGIDFYNILTKIGGFRRRGRKLMKPAPADDEDAKVDEIMNNQVKQALNISVGWGDQSGSVFSYLNEDFMKPVTDIVESLLNTTDIKVGVYNGQLDLIVDTPGTIKWVDQLKFDQSAKWKNARRSSLVANGIIEGYVKKAGNLAFYWVDRAGHMVPRDNPAAMHYILDDITEGFKVINKN